MTTATEIINHALGTLGVKAPGDAVQGDEAAQALLRLNTLLDAWRTESLYAYTTQRVVGTVSAQTATIGPASPTDPTPPSPDFVCDPRPVRIEHGFYTLDGVDRPIKPVSAAEYDAICLKGIASTGPCVVYLDASVPVGTLYFYPVPAGAVVTLAVQTHMTEFADLTTSYDLPPGYRRALALSLAEEVAPEYERDVTPTTKTQAALARKNIKRANHVVGQLDVRSYAPRHGSYLDWANA